MCAAADAVKESVTSHYAARNRAAAALPPLPHPAPAPGIAAAAIEELLFGEASGCERWLHEYVAL